LTRVGKGNQVKGTGSFCLVPFTHTSHTTRHPLVLQALCEVDGQPRTPTKST